MKYPANSLVCKECKAYKIKPEGIKPSEWKKEIKNFCAEHAHWTKSEKTSFFFR